MLEKRQLSACWDELDCSFTNNNLQAELSSLNFDSPSFPSDPPTPVCSSTCSSIFEVLSSLSHAVLLMLSPFFLCFFFQLETSLLLEMQAVVRQSFVVF